MTRYAVAAGHRLTAEAAAEILADGGNAVDAAIAAALTACAAEPALSSFFGGGFLMAREASGRARLLDFFVQTPRRKAAGGETDFRAIEADFGGAKQTFHIGAGAIAAPGVPRGLAEAHRRLGRAPFRRLAEPAIRTAKEGAVVSEMQSSIFRIIVPILTATPAARALFGDGDGVLKAGAVLRNPAFADLLEVYAHEGDRFAQEGEAAAALLALPGGHLSADDLKHYEAIWRTPLVETRGGARLTLNPPPSLGGALIAFALRLLPKGPGAADLARAFAATSRARLEVELNRDPAGGAARLLDGDLVARYRAEIAGRRAATTGTTHVSVVDAEGMGAAITLSSGAGCGLIAPGTGAMPNNMLGEDDLAAGDLDDWPTDTRLSSMMAPMAIEWPDGTLAMLGSGGSNRIRTALARVAALLIDGKGPLDEAIAAPRLHVERPHEPKVDAEDRFPEAERAALLAAFPEATLWPNDSMFFGGVHAVRRWPGGDAEAAADPRRDGHGLTG